MRKFLLANLIILCGITFSAENLYAQTKKEPIRVNNSIVVDKGDITETGVLSDAKGKIFVEFPEGLKITYQEDKTAFVGEILPPKITGIPTKAPKVRMKDLLSFELTADIGEQLIFTQKINALHPRNRLRLSILSPESLDGASSAKVVLLIKKDENARDARLWRFINEKDGWERIGGVYKTSEDAEYDIFSAKILSTGVYTLFDESPLPTEYADQYYLPPQTLAKHIQEYFNHPEVSLETATAEPELESVLENLLQDIRSGQTSNGQTGELPDFVFPDDIPSEFLPPAEFSGVSSEASAKDEENSAPNFNTDISEIAPVVPALNSAPTQTELPNASLVPAEDTTTLNSENPIPVRLPTAGPTNASLSNNPSSFPWFLVILVSVTGLIGGSIYLAAKQPKL